MIFNVGSDSLYVTIVPPSYRLGELGVPYRVGSFRMFKSRNLSSTSFSVEWIKIVGEVGEVFFEVKTRQYLIYDLTWAI